MIVTLFKIRMNDLSVSCHSALCIPRTWLCGGCLTSTEKGDQNYPFSGPKHIQYR